MPQAWAAGALVHLVTILLGVEADASSSLLELDPALPEWLDEIVLANLRVGPGAVDLRVSRNKAGVHQLHVEHRRGEMTVRLRADAPST